MNKLKDFEIGRKYRLKENGICVVKYLGDNVGEG